MNNPLRALIVIAAIFIGSGLVRCVRAQWGIGLELQRAAYGGTSRDTSAGGPGGSFRPGGTPAVTLRLDRRFGRTALGLGVRYSRSSVLLDTQDLFVGIHNELAAIEFAPEIRVRIARAHSGAALHLYGGPVVGVCMFKDHDTRVVPGAIVGVAGEFPLLDRLELLVRVGGGLTRSMFQDGELPAEFERHTTRRSEIGFGLRYGR